jgi:hypothetical protein
MKEKEMDVFHDDMSNQFVFQGEIMDLEKAATLEKELLQEYNNVTKQLGDCETEISMHQSTFQVKKHINECLL